KAEWASILADDPLNKQRRLIPFRLEEFEVEGLLGSLASVDLFGMNEARTRQVLIKAVSFVNRKAKRDFPGEAGKKPRFPADQPAVWNVPEQNRNFTGRDEILEKLRDTLASGQAAAVTAVHGLGGVGKTQVAAEYCWRYRSFYSHVWWVRAEAETTLGTEMAELARRVGEASEELPDQKAKDAAIEWLRRNKGWLLVLDNAPDAKACRDCLLRGEAGHTIVTSR
ncbi:MAG: ATP-binding protein, partial [bacterium]|nr:ATP-binding protein [bacterium]